MGDKTSVTNAVILGDHLYNSNSNREYWQTGLDYKGLLEKVNRDWFIRTIKENRINIGI